MKSKRRLLLPVDPLKKVSWNMSSRKSCFLQDCWWKFPWKLVTRKHTEILLANCVKISIICWEHLDWKQSFSVLVAVLSQSCMPYGTSIWHVCKHFWFPKYFENWINFHCLHWPKFCSVKECVAVHPYWCRKISESFEKQYQGVLRGLSWFIGAKTKKITFLTLSHVLFDNVHRSFWKINYVSFVNNLHQVEQSSVFLWY